MATGTIRTIISGKRFGIIESSGDAADYVFDEFAVEGANFGVLKTGQRVSFDEASDPCEAGYRRAYHVHVEMGVVHELAAGSGRR